MLYGLALNVAALGWTLLLLGVLALALVLIVLFVLPFLARQTRRLSSYERRQIEETKREPLDPKDRIVYDARHELDEFERRLRDR